MEEKGEKMKVSCEWEKGKMMVFAVVFSLWNLSGFSEYEKETTNEDFGKRHEAFKSLQEPTRFCNKICSLKAPKHLATI